MKEIRLTDERRDALIAELQALFAVEFDEPISDFRAGEIMDLEAGGRLEGGVDAVEIADGIMSAYRSLWRELTEIETFEAREAWRITERVERLNELGFDIGEMSMQTTADGTRVSIQPKVSGPTSPEAYLAFTSSSDKGPTLSSPTCK